MKKSTRSSLQTARQPGFPYRLTTFPPIRLGNMMRAGKTGVRTGESGSVTVEVAFVMLPLFAILFMTIDLGWVIFGSACIQEGAREGVRYAVTGSGQPEGSLDSAVKQVVQQYSFGFVTASNVSVDYYPPNGYSSAGAPASLDGTSHATVVGNIVKVTVQGVAIRSFGPLFRSSTPMQVSASATDVLQ